MLLLLPHGSSEARPLGRGHSCWVAGFYQHQPVRPQSSVHMRPHEAIRACPDFYVFFKVVVALRWGRHTRWTRFLGTLSPQQLAQPTLLLASRRSVLPAVNGIESGIK